MPKKVLTNTEAAWLAGFIDGEGSIQIRWQRAKRDTHMTSSVASISISQAEPRTEVLYWLQNKFGGAVSSHGTNARNPNHNKAFRWLVTGTAAVEVAKLIRPYLKLKARHVDILLEHQQTKLSSHIGVRKGMARDQVRISDEVIALRNQHIEEIKLLNKRGKA